MKGPIGTTLKPICFSEYTPIRTKIRKIAIMKDIHLGDIKEPGIGFAEPNN